MSRRSTRNRSKRRSRYGGKRRKGGKTHRRHLARRRGGSADVPLAYTGNRVTASPNPYLAYTGKGGAKPTIPVGANLHSSFQAGGGSDFYQPAAFYPNGTVGNSWTPSVGGWPGVDGISSDRNFLALNTYPNDPQTQNVLDTRTVSNYGLKGGKRRRRTRRGGALNDLIPSDLINPVRVMSNSLQNTVASLQGRTLAPNPLPENAQLRGI